MSFVVFALPRSRTAWLSTFLTYGGWTCGHEEARHLRALEDVESWLKQPCTGTVETGVAPWWRFLQGRNVRVVTVRRPVEEVVASLMRLPVAFNEELLRKAIIKADRKLDQIEARLPCISVRFADLSDEMACVRVFEHCLPFEHDHEWWSRLQTMNVQVSLLSIMRYYEAHAPQLMRLVDIARHRAIAGMRRRHSVSMEAVTFQQEPLAQAFLDQDGQRLMAAECVAMGEHAKAWMEMNIPLLAKLEEMDRLHIYTARSNGRMFGYLVTALGEAFHARGQMEADQVSYFADPAWPGLGRKLQAASIENLRRRGVNRVLMFQPDGARVGAVYRRLGAQQTGQRFVLELQ